jgi:uncharacterized membrane protein YphA (DoxX/SURF4 family)
VACSTQLVAGPMLALGPIHSLAACPIVVFLVVSNYERWRVGGFFWNKMGLEFMLMWTVAALYFLRFTGRSITAWQKLTTAAAPLNRLPAGCSS